MDDRVLAGLNASPARFIGGHADAALVVAAPSPEPVLYS